MEIFKDFSFEAAHKLPHVPEGHKCGRLHGHSFKVTVNCSGPIQEDGMVLDFADIKTAFAPIHEALDHRFLNDVGGVLHNPTSEHVAYWIWHRLKERLPVHIQLKVSVQETCTSGCTYTGQP